MCFYPVPKWLENYIKDDIAEVEELYQTPRSLDVGVEVWRQLQEDHEKVTQKFYEGYQRYLRYQETQGMPIPVYVDAWMSLFEDRDWSTIKKLLTGKASVDFTMRSCLLYRGREWN